MKIQLAAHFPSLDGAVPGICSGKVAALQNEDALFLGFFGRNYDGSNPTGSLFGSICMYKDLEQRSTEFETHTILYVPLETRWA
jgi:hypothetical protein